MDWRNANPEADREKDEEMEDLIKTIIDDEMDDKETSMDMRDDDEPENNAMSESNDEGDEVDPEVVEKMSELLSHFGSKSSTEASDSDSSESNTVVDPNEVQDDYSSSDEENNEETEGVGMDKTSASDGTDISTDNTGHPTDVAVQKTETPKPSASTKGPAVTTAPRPLMAIRRNWGLFPWERENFTKFTRKKLDEAGKAYRKTIPSSRIPIPIVESFEGMNLKPEILRGIADRQLTTPATWQEHVIMPMILGRDVICQAQSGLGKTVAFTLPILQRMDVNDPNGKALILAPTRELAQQILREVRILGKHLGVKCVACIGSVSAMDVNKIRLEQPYNIIVGTVGRVWKLMRNRDILGSTIKTVVIDEADKMLTERSFIWKLQWMFERISATAQFIAASATIPDDALERCKQLMYDPFELLVDKELLTLDGISQFYVRVKPGESKLDLLEKWIPHIQSVQGLTFCNRRDTAEVVANTLRSRGHKAELLIGSMEQQKRVKQLGDFAAREIPTLITSDLIGRGIDDDHVKLVVNYDIPTHDRQIYIHRIGRAGRQGNKGVAITLIANDREFEGMRLLQVYYQMKITELKDDIQEVLKLVQ